MCIRDRPSTTHIELRIQSFEDSLVEGPESFEVTATNFFGAPITGITFGEGTIVDNDAAPTVTIGHGSGTEGSLIEFPVSLDFASSGDIALELATTDGSATGNIDFETANFEYSLDGGVVWQSADGINATEFTLPALSLIHI